jgi:hypothetical protein
MSMKQFLRLPVCLPSSILERLLVDTTSVAVRAQEQVANKIHNRFTGVARVDTSQRGDIQTIFLHRMPSNFRAFFAG